MVNKTRQEIDQMNKIDKLLYGGFAVVAIGVVAVMLVSILSSPKQIEEEAVEPPTPPQTEQAPMETAAPVDDLVPPDGYVGYYLDDDGNKVCLTEEEIAASDAIEAEFKRKEEEQKAREKAEEEWWESRKEWIERFPFESTPHPEIKFDPTMYDSRKVFRGEWPEEKKDKAYRDMMRRVEHHSLLKMFYDSWVPYTEEFEQLHDIVQEELGEVGSTVALAVTFRTLAKYHKAAQRDPDSVYRENVRVELPVPEANELLEQEFVLGEDFFSLPEEGQQVYLAALLEPRRKAIRDQIDPPTERRDVTWREETEMLKECLLGPLGDLQIDGERIPEEQALAIRERLINEIPAAGFLELPKVVFSSNTKYEFQLKPGDPLLIK